MIVVTGSTGHVGRLVADELVRLDRPFRLVVRDPSRAPRLAGGDVVAAGYEDQTALADALQEGDDVFMVSIHTGPERRVELHRSFIEASARAGVAHVVYLSFVGAAPDAIFSHARSHGMTEQLLERSGLPFTAIRNGMYADEIPGWFNAEGVNRVPGGDGRMSFSRRRELAEVIAAVLTGREHRANSYDITTPESVTMAELARIASEVTGDAYRHEPVEDDEWEAGWRARGRAEWQIEAGRSSYAALRAGEFDVVSDDYRAITGRDPQTIAGVIAWHAHEMPLAPGGSP